MKWSHPRVLAVAGGLAAGPAFAALSGGIDSPAAAWRTPVGRVMAPASWAAEMTRARWQTGLAQTLLGVCLGGALVLLWRPREAARMAARETVERQLRKRTEELRLANERLATLAMTDELTGVANRRRLMERIEEAMAFARRHGVTLSILLADLDGFKEINDRLGHAVGDEVLRRVARALERALRTEDLLGRYGGDEFIAVLPGTSLVSASEAGERLRRAVRDLELGLSALGFTNPLSISVGVASFEGTFTEPLELVRRADLALYRAKAQGKNRVGPPVLPPTPDRLPVVLVPSPVR